MFKCNHCGALEYSTVSMANHLKTQHEGAKADDFTQVKYRCPECGWVFDHFTGCRNHAYLYHTVFNIDCEEVPA